MRKKYNEWRRSILLRWYPITSASTEGAKSLVGCSFWYLRGSSENSSIMCHQHFRQSFAVESIVAFAAKASNSELSSGSYGFLAMCILVVAFTSYSI